MTESVLERAKEIPRTNHSNNLYKAAFGEILQPGAHILDIGAGDSKFAEMNADYDIVRLDAQYGEQTPENSERAVAGLANELPFKDESFDTTLSSFVMQHIPEEEVVDVVREMTRVTKTAETPETRNGVVAIYPVYDKQKLRGLINEAGAKNIAAVGFMTDAMLDHDQLSYPTFYIHKKPGQEKTVQTLIDNLAETDVFQPKARMERLGAMARRFAIRMSGNTKRSTNAAKK